MDRALVRAAPSVVLSHHEHFMKSMSARIPLFNRLWWLREVIRLTEALHYSEAMKRAGVPEKRRLKILRGWSPLAYSIRRELRGVRRDLQRREWETNLAYLRDRQWS